MFEIKKTHKTKRQGLFVSILSFISLTVIFLGLFTTGIQIYSDSADQPEFKPAGGIYNINTQFNGSPSITQVNASDYSCGKENGTSNYYCRTGNTNSYTYYKCIGDNAATVTITCTTKLTGTLGNDPTIAQLQAATTTSQTTQNAQTPALNFQNATFTDSQNNSYNGRCSIIPTDPNNSVCTVTTNGTTLNFYDCIQRATNGTTSISCNQQSNFTGTATNAGQIVNAGSLSGSNTGTDPNTLTKPSNSESSANLITVLFNLVTAILTILVWLFGTFLNVLLYYLGLIFVILLRMNPASNEWIKVAESPWGVVQSIANLVILSSFIFIAFAYILNIKQYKTKIDDFITNIIIVAIVINLTLLGAASIVNIAQGIGDAFVGAYIRIKGGDATNTESIADAYIGATVETFKELSAVRCGSLNSGESSTTTPAPASTNTTPTTQSYLPLDFENIQNPLSLFNLKVNTFAQTQTTPPTTPTNTPAPTETQTITGANKASECGNDATLANLGTLFGNILNADTGPNTQALIREVVYVVVICFGIYVFFRLMLLALTRAVALWLLMITSPLALVAYFSPEGLGLKKQGTEWGNKFFHYTIFYPAFAFALILVQELIGAFRTASEAGANELSNQDDLNKIILIIMGGIVAVGSLKLLADFFEGVFKEISQAAWGGIKAAASVGATGLRGVGNAIPAVSGALSKSVGKSTAKLSSDLKLKQAELKTLPVGNARRQELLTEIAKGKKSLARQKKRMAVYTKLNAAGTAIRDSITNPLANFTEMIPERIEQIEKIPGSVKDKWALQKKARIASFNAGDKARSELWLRQNEWAQGIFGNPDLDPNAVYRGLSAGQIAEKTKDDSNWAKKQVQNAVAEAYSRTLGTDKAIAKQYAVARARELLKNAGGQYSNLQGIYKDQFNDIISQNQGDTAIMSEFANDKDLKGAVRDALFSGQLSSDAISGLRKNSPIFIADADERRKAIFGLGEQDFKNMASYNLEDADIVNAARANPNVKFEDIEKKMNNRGHTYLTEDIQRVKFKEMLDKGQISSEEYTRQIAASNSRYKEGYYGSTDVALRIAQAQRNDPNITEERKKEIASEVEREMFGNQQKVQAIINGSEYGGIDYGRMNPLDRVSMITNEARAVQQYVSENNQSINADPLLGLQEIGRNIEATRESYDQAKDTYLLRQIEIADQVKDQLIDRDATKAAFDQEINTLDQLQNFNGNTIRGVLRKLSNVPEYVDIARGLGIRKTMNEISQKVQTSKANRVVTTEMVRSDPTLAPLLDKHLTEVGTNKYDLRDVANRTQDLEKHLSRIAVAYNQILNLDSSASTSVRTKAIENFEKAKNEAKQVFSKTKDVNNLIDQNFTLQGGIATPNFMTSTMEEKGMKEIDNLKNQVESKMIKDGKDINNDTASYEAYTREVLTPNINNIKDRSKSAIDNSAKKFTIVSNSEVDALPEAEKLT